MTTACCGFEYQEESILLLKVPVCLAKQLNRLEEHFM